MVDGTGSPRRERQAALLNAARLFHRAHSHLRVPYGYTVDGLQLGAFLSRCRRKAAAGKLARDIADELTGLDPYWRDGAGIQPRHEPMLAAARTYFGEHGHLLVPKSYVPANGAGLGWWLSDRRNQQRAGTLNPYLAKELEAVDPRWGDLQDPAVNKRAAYDARGVAGVQEFLAAYGHARIPGRYVTSTGFKLGDWLTRRKTEMRQGSGDSRLAGELARLGIVWKRKPKAPKVRGPRPDPAAKYLDALSGFREIHGHARVPSEYVTSDGLRLGRWLVRQRVAYRKGKLRPDVETALHTLGVNLSNRSRQRPARRG